MDAETRGFIESLMDEMLKEETVKEVKWVQKEIPVSSLRDIVLGYAIGYLKALADYTLALRTRHLKRITKSREEKEEKEILAIIKRRVPEILKRINRELNR